MAPEAPFGGECRSCGYWLEYESRNGYGQCRRSAPQLDSKDFAKWPATRIEEGCGEFKARGAA